MEFSPTDANFRYSTTALNKSRALYCYIVVGGE